MPRYIEKERSNPRLQATRMKPRAADAERYAAIKMHRLISVLVGSMIASLAYGQTRMDLKAYEQLCLMRDDFFRVAREVCLRRFPEYRQEIEAAHKLWLERNGDAQVHIASICREKREQLIRDEPSTASELETMAPARYESAKQEWEQDGDRNAEIGFRCRQYPKDLADERKSSITPEVIEFYRRMLSNKALLSK